jgi:hypothetical protein
MTISLSSANATPALASASCVGSIATTVLTVTSMIYGILAVGQRIDVPGIVAGTTIASLGTGTGAAGTYNLSVTQSTITSQTINAGRTLLYTCPALKTSTIFGGQVSNLDDVNMQNHLVTIDRLMADGVTWSNIVNRIPIAYGGALPFPKTTLLAGEKVFVRVDSPLMLGVDISFAERI